MPQKRGDINFIEHSQSARCFADLNREDLEFLDSRITRLTYYPGETLFKQGAFAPHVLYIMDGLGRTYLQTGPDKQLNIRLVVSGDFLAYSTVFGTRVYTYSAVAIRESIVCMIDREALRKVLLKNPEFAMRITSFNYRNEEALLGLIRNLSYKQMRGKLASALLYLSGEEFMKLDIFRDLNRQDIADFAAITPESAIRFLKEFEKEGIIQLDGKEIRIRHRERLEAISKRG